MLEELEASWKVKIGSEFDKPYFNNLRSFLALERSKYTLFPPEEFIFNAFTKCPFDDVKVVIIGQDPYHGEGQANGLCFSVKEGVKLPPSLKNIMKERASDLGKDIPLNGDLEYWAKQGVLMLNATLTVRANTAGSHQKKGWEEFTDAVIKCVSEQKENIVFILWGNYAQKKGLMIEDSKHCVLKAAHPSPFSAYNGFFGCAHFSKTNEYLKAKGIQEINW